MTQRITSIDQIYDVQTQTCLIKDKDFSYKDLSNLDLSSIPSEFWENATFYYTNFKNTGIKFYPRLLRNGVEGCDFSDNDLSYLNKCYGVLFKSIDKANFRNTNLRNYTQRYLADEKCSTFFLDESFINDMSEDYWNRQSYIKIDFLRKNPSIKLSLWKSLEIIKEEIPSKEMFLTYDEIEENLKKCEKYLDEFDCFKLIKRFYNKICKEAKNSMQRLRFFQGVISDYKFTNVIFDELDFKVLNTNFFIFRKCKFENVIFNLRVEDTHKSLILNKTNEFCNTQFPNIDYSDWRNIVMDYDSLNSRMTIRKNIYVELGKQCNCECKFCRNQSFKCNRYNLKRIKKNLKSITRTIDSIVIGGGEPTLRFDDLIQIIDDVGDVSVISNGSMDLNQLGILLGKCDSIYISRHSIDDEENINILKPKKNTNIMTFKEIESLVSSEKNRIIFSPVCVKGGLDSSEKVIRYIVETFKIGIKTIIISSLHEDASLGGREINYEDLYVDPIIFNDVKKSLLYQGFSQKDLIVSTGGYTLNIFYNDRMKVIFKEYVNKETLKQKWIHSYKKTFDFSMLPNGDVYEDWSQEKKIDIEELKTRNLLF